MLFSYVHLRYKFAINIRGKYRNYVIKWKILRNMKKTSVNLNGKIIIEHEKYTYITVDEES
ncbi:hypothetical protein COL93_17855 [Bacillus toyonensis]|uniref:Uncharacterized protein n=1 Tax=Bacillus toyonensis TaxID=155322 RepID=A0A2C4R320_9BACI|nr:hypothetical protein COL93_17855 [Bacillus toyonensis]PHD71786.1 hypothetical protein COF40_07630 [Bacillus toyonensis]